MRGFGGPFMTRAVETTVFTLVLGVYLIGCAGNPGGGPQPRGVRSPESIGVPQKVREKPRNLGVASSSETWRWPGIHASEPSAGPPGLDDATDQSTGDGCLGSSEAPFESASAASTSRGATTGRENDVLFVEFVVTPQDVVDRMLRMARVSRDDVVYDLGCGDGRIVVTAARRYGCRAVGYDLDRLRVAETRVRARREGVAHLVTIELKDVLKADLDGATVVTLYLGTELNARLIPHLAKLGPGCRIVSHDFGLGDIPPDQTVELTSREDHRRHKIHLWTCPLRPMNPVGKRPY